MAYVGALQEPAERMLQRLFGEGFGPRRYLGEVIKELERDHRSQLDMLCEVKDPAAVAEYMRISPFTDSDLYIGAVIATRAKRDRITDFAYHTMAVNQQPVALCSTYLLSGSPLPYCEAEISQFDAKGAEAWFAHMPPSESVLFDFSQHSQQWGKRGRSKIWIHAEPGETMVKVVANTFDLLDFYHSTHPCASTEKIREAVGNLPKRGPIEAAFNNMEPLARLLMEADAGFG